MDRQEGRQDEGWGGWMGEGVTKPKYPFAEQAPLPSSFPKCLRRTRLLGLVFRPVLLG